MGFLQVVFSGWPWISKRDSEFTTSHVLQLIGVLTCSSGANCGTNKRPRTRLPTMPSRSTRPGIFSPRASASTTNVGVCTYLASHLPTTAKITRDSKTSLRSSSSGSPHNSQVSIALLGVFLEFHFSNSASDMPKPMTSLLTSAVTSNSSGFHETKRPSTSNRSLRIPAHKVSSTGSVARSTASRVNTNMPAKLCWL